MSKIFGISNNPISTIDSALKGMHHVDPPERVVTEIQRPVVKNIKIQTVKATKSNPIVKMRNGFGKLLSHFSKVRVK